MVQKGPPLLSAEAGSQIPEVGTGATPQVEDATPSVGAPGIPKLRREGGRSRPVIYRLAQLKPISAEYLRGVRHRSV